MGQCMTVEIAVESRIADAPTGGGRQCWRCGGAGTVVMEHSGETTPCGACLGKEAPKPCPECDQSAAKILWDLGTNTICWRCRNCGHRGPEFPGDKETDYEALKAWNEQ